MPIRFRCAYCNQLMGIAVRKAGTVVRCPKCAGDIIVPTLEPGVVPEPDDADDKFEDSDFERKLQDIDAKTTKELPGSPTKRVVPTPIPVPPRRGIFLSTGMLFLSISVIVVLLVLVFILGVAVSRNSAGP
ncbi:MAG: hypothetical protein EXS16_08630 [Gemmataceae bacterium]|nr:hypothetical protein [Gemmataceae bacterium]